MISYFIRQSKLYLYSKISTVVSTGFKPSGPLYVIND